MSAFIRVGRLLGWLSCFGMFLVNLVQWHLEMAMVFGMLTAIIGDLIIVDV